MTVHEERVSTKAAYASQSRVAAARRRSRRIPRQLSWLRLSQTRHQPVFGLPHGSPTEPIKMGSTVLFFLSSPGPDTRAQCLHLFEALCHVAHDGAHAHHGSILAPERDD